MLQPHRFLSQRLRRNRLPCCPRGRRTGAFLTPLLASFAIVSAFGAPSTPPVVYLWPSGAATLQGGSEKEITVPPDAQPGQRINSIRNVHNPSIEVRLPSSDRATGAAIIVAPGGGHQQL